MDDMFEQFCTTIADAIVTIAQDEQDTQFIVQHDGERFSWTTRCQPAMGGMYARPSDAVVNPWFLCSFSPDEARSTLVEVFVHDSDLRHYLRQKMDRLVSNRSLWKRSI